MEPRIKNLNLFGLTHGPVSSYLKDAGLISPDEGQIEAIEFHVDILADGSIDFESPSVRVSPGFAFLFHNLIGAVSHPTFETSAVNHLVSAQVFNEGRQKPVFRRPIPMHLLVAPGPAQNIEWKSIFRFFESADISVEWVIDTAAYAAVELEEEKTFTVLLIGELVRDNLLPIVERGRE